MSQEEKKLSGDVKSSEMEGAKSDASREMNMRAEGSTSEGGGGGGEPSLGPSEKEVVSAVTTERESASHVAGSADGSEERPAAKTLRKRSMHTKRRRTISRSREYEAKLASQSSFPCDSCGACGAASPLSSASVALLTPIVVMVVLAALAISFLLANGSTSEISSSSSSSKCIPASPGELHALLYGMHSAMIRAKPEIREINMTTRRDGSQFVSIDGEGMGSMIKNEIPVEIKLFEGKEIGGILCKQLGAFVPESERGSHLFTKSGVFYWPPNTQIRVFLSAGQSAKPFSDASDIGRLVPLIVGYPSHGAPSAAWDGIVFADADEGDSPTLPFEYASISRDHPSGWIYVEWEPVQL